MNKINPYRIVKQASLFDDAGYIPNDKVLAHKTDLIAPIIGLLLGGGYGAYTGKGVSNKILRALAGAGIGGLAGMGVNHILDRTVNSQAMSDIQKQFEGLRASNSSLSQQLKDEQARRLYAEERGILNGDRDLMQMLGVPLPETSEDTIILDSPTQTIDVP